MKKLIFFCCFFVALNATEKKPFIGLASSAMSKPLAQQLGINSNYGVIIQHVLKGSPAEKAGLKPFDVILKINDHRIISDVPLAKVIKLFQVGDEVQVLIIRQTKKKIIKLKLIEVPPHFRKQQSQHHRMKLRELIEKQMRLGQGSPADPEKFFKDHSLFDQQNLSLGEIEKLMQKMRQQVLQDFNKHKSHQKHNYLQKKHYSSITQRCKDYTITINRQGNQRTVHIKDLTGKTIYQGSAKKTPKEYALKVQSLLERLEQKSSELLDHSLKI